MTSYVVTKADGSQVVREEGKADVPVGGSFSGGASGGSSSVSPTSGGAIGLYYTVPDSSTGTYTMIASNPDTVPVVSPTGTVISGGRTIATMSGSGDVQTDISRLVSSTSGEPISASTYMQNPNLQTTQSKSFVQSTVLPGEHYNLNVDTQQYSRPLSLTSNVQLTKPQFDYQTAGYITAEAADRGYLQLASASNLPMDSGVYTVLGDTGDKTKDIGGPASQTFIQAPGYYKFTEGVESGAPEIKKSYKKAVERQGIDIIPVATTNAPRAKGIEIFTLQSGASDVKAADASNKAYFRSVGKMYDTPPVVGPAGDMAGVSAVKAYEKKIPFMPKAGPQELVDMKGPDYGPAASQSLNTAAVSEESWWVPSIGRELKVGHPIIPEGEGALIPSGAPIRTDAEVAKLLKEGYTKSGYDVTSVTPVGKGKFTIIYSVPGTTASTTKTLTPEEAVAMAARSAKTSTAGPQATSVSISVPTEKVGAGLWGAQDIAGTIFSTAAPIAVTPFVSLKNQLEGSFKLGASRPSAPSDLISGVQKQMRVPSETQATQGKLAVGGFLEGFGNIYKKQAGFMKESEYTVAGLESGGEVQGYMDKGMTREEATRKYYSAHPGSRERAIVEGGLLTAGIQAPYAVLDISFTTSGWKTAGNVLKSGAETVSKEGFIEGGKTLVSKGAPALLNIAGKPAEVVAGLFEAPPIIRGAASAAYGGFSLLSTGIYGIDVATGAKENESPFGLMSAYGRGNIETVGKFARYYTLTSGKGERDDVVSGYAIWNLPYYGVQAIPSGTGALGKGKEIVYRAMNLGSIGYLYGSNINDVAIASGRPTTDVGPFKFAIPTGTDIMRGAGRGAAEISTFELSEKWKPGGVDVMWEESPIYGKTSEIMTAQAKAGKLNVPEYSKYWSGVELHLGEGGGPKYSMSTSVKGAVPQGAGPASFDITKLQGRDAAGMFTTVTRPGYAMEIRGGSVRGGYSEDVFGKVEPTVRVETSTKPVLTAMDIKVDTRADVKPDMTFDMKPGSGNVRVVPTIRPDIDIRPTLDIGRFGVDTRGGKGDTDFGKFDIEIKADPDVKPDIDQDIKPDTDVKPEIKIGNPGMLLGLGPIFAATDGSRGTGHTAVSTKVGVKGSVLDLLSVSMGPTRVLGRIRGPLSPSFAITQTNSSPVRPVGRPRGSVAKKGYVPTGRPVGRPKGSGKKEPTSAPMKMRTPAQQRVDDIIERSFSKQWGNR